MNSRRQTVQLFQLLSISQASERVISKQKMLYVLCILVLVELGPNHVFAINCPNRNYCHTNEVKYRSFSALHQSYLNSTNHVIRSFQLTSINGCIQECTRTQGCQSANYFAPNASAMICDLISGNRWSNATLLINRENSTHFFIKSPCSSNPCKNGATCISLDQENSYKCACQDYNYTTTFYGSHCEGKIVAEKTAQAFFNFEQTPPKDVKESSRSYSEHGDARVLRVPSRNSHVLYLPGKSGSYATFNGYTSADCFIYLYSCKSYPKTGLTVSLWFKLLKRAQERTPLDSCSAHEVNLADSTNSAYTLQGFRINLNGCRNNAFTVGVRGWSTLCSVSWGNAQNASLHQSWSHFLFTYHYQTGLVLYFNGAEVQRQTTLQSVTTASYGTILSLGSGGKNSLEAYVDDVAVWYNNITPTDVAFLYERGKMNNAVPAS